MSDMGQPCRYHGHPAAPGAIRPHSDAAATLRRRLSRSRRAHFEKALTIAPRYKRVIFYCGEAFHSGHVDAPDLTANDSLTGRLTVNAYFRLRMAAG
jgi:hypothetical protein